MNSGTAAQHALTLSVGAFVDELVRSGVRHFCVCPGSRSTPLALMIARRPEVRLWMHIDERSAAFFALGLAKTRQEPVALVCTSGTAVANFLPAVVEAFYARVPLVVLTADRPHELRDCGAPQTIDQIDLFGRHVKWFADLPEPLATPELIRYIRTIACRAVATALQCPAGPVHINCPYREPLMPSADARVVVTEGRDDNHPYVFVTHGPRMLSKEQAIALAAELWGTQRGLIICGPQDDPAPADALVRLARSLGYPILADPLSGMRSGDHDQTLVLDCYDAFLRDSTFAEQFAPEVVLRFGAMPTSKPLLLYLQRHPGCRQIVVDGGAGWNEPTQLAARVVHAEARLFCAALADVLPPAPAGDTERENWLAAWKDADHVARTAITARFEALDDLFDGKVFAELAQLLPDNSVLYVGNSMPVRDLDTFFPCVGRSIRVLANRGANGIDGVVSSALGASVAEAGRVVLVIGDLSFYHDSNALLAAAQHKLKATIVLINNDGGGIFSFLPQSADAEHFETLFGTPHGLDFRPLVEMHGARFARVKTWEEFRAAMRWSFEDDGLCVVEVPTERNRNVTLHRELWWAVSEALAPANVPAI